MTQLPGFPYFSDQVAFSIDPNTPYTAAQLAAAWVDITARVRGVSGLSQGRQYELGQPQAGQGTYSVRNDDELLNPSNPSSPYAGQLVPYRLIRTVAAWPLTGNLLNDANAAWGVTAATGNFEDGTTAGWAPGGAAITPTLTNDTAHVHSGTKALKATFAGTPGAFAGAFRTILVMPGVPTTISAWVYLGAGLSTTSITASGFSFGNVISTTGSYQRTQLTFTPTTATLLIAVEFTGTGAGSAWIDDIQVEFAATASAYSSSGSVLYGDFYGFVERWPEQWTYRGFYGYGDLPVVDAFGMLPRTILTDVAAEEIATDTPQAYYPCTEGSEAAQVSDITGNNGPGVIVTPPGAPGACTIGDSESVTMDPFPSIAVAGTADFTLAIGCPYLQFPPSMRLPANNWTLEWCIHIDPEAIGALNQSEALLEQGGPFYAGAVFLITNNNDAYLPVTLTYMGPGGFQGTVAQITTAGHHHIAFALAADGKTQSLWIDGALTSFVDSVARNIPSDPRGLRIGTINPVPGRLNFNAGRVALFNGVLSTARVQAHALAATAAFDGELSGARYARLMGYSTTAIPSVVDAGMTPMGPAVGLAGAALLAALNDVVDAESGQHYVGRDGPVNFLSRARRYSTAASAWVLGENEAGGELPYEGDIAFDYDPQYIYNDVTSQRPGGVIQVAVDAASIGQFFDSPLTLAPNVHSDNESADIATWTMQQHKYARERVQAVTFRAAANPNLWPFALGVKQGDRVTVKRRTSAFTMALDFWVENVARTRGTSQYDVTLLLSPIWLSGPPPTPTPLTVWILGDATYSVLGTTTTLAR